MVKGRMRMSGFCMSRAMRSHNSRYSNDKAEPSRNSFEMNFNGDAMSKPESQLGNRVMFVVDSLLKFKAALDWALSHSVQSHHTIVLLHVIKPFKQGADYTMSRSYELLCSAKDMCQTRRPEVKVEIAVVERKEKGKGATIVEEAKQQRISLLVLGNRKHSILQRIVRRMLRGRRRTSIRVAEYCIQNANCMTIAVRRKSGKSGGYLITTKRHKNFWILA